MHNIPYNIINTPLPCNWSDVQSLRKPEHICEDLPENPMLFNKTSLGEGSFGKVSLYTKDNIIFEQPGNVTDFCNIRTNTCIVKKKLHRYDNHEKHISNEVNILWMLSHLPQKYNIYFPTLYGYQNNVAEDDNNFYFDEDDKESVKIPEFAEDGYSGGFYGGLRSDNISIYQTYSGITLYTYMIEYAPIPFDKVIYIMMFISKALCVLHACQLCHYDLKPQNITIQLDEDGAIKGVNLIDFGVSRFIQNNKAYLILRNNNGFFTELCEESISGNNLYSGPEAFDDSDIRTQMSDIWNIGSIFVELLTGIPVSILLIINDNNDINDMSYEKICELRTTTKIWNNVMFPISLARYESKGSFSVYAVVKTFLTKFFESKPSVMHKYIPSFINEISSAFIYVKHGATTKKRISSRELFRSIKKLFIYNKIYNKISQERQ